MFCFQDKDLEMLTEQAQQLELYLQEKQDLIKVGLDSPHPMRNACSETVLNSDEMLGVDDEYPSKTASLHFVDKLKKMIEDRFTPTPSGDSLFTSSDDDDDAVDDDEEEEKEFVKILL